MSERDKVQEKIAPHSSSPSAEEGDFKSLSQEWMEVSARKKYSYNFTWLGRPIIQYPQDIVALQEIIWRTRPDVIIETGIAHGGSLILSASILELLGGSGCVIGIDIDIRAHNRVAIEGHPLYKRVSLIEGSSTDEEVIASVRKRVASKRVMVILDSNHTEAHVLAELDAYAPMVSKDCYLVVLDTIIETLPPDLHQGRPWKQGNNPLTAVQKFLRLNDRFVLDRSIQDKLLLTVAADGYLLCVKERSCAVSR